MLDLSFGFRGDRARQVWFQARHGRTIQMGRCYDYRTNVTLYPKWQSFLREQQPKTLNSWGQDDIFFTPEGGEAYVGFTNGRGAPFRGWPLRGGRLPGVYY
jgi:hypothetical protein